MKARPQKLITALALALALSAVLIGSGQAADRPDNRAGIRGIGSQPADYSDVFTRAVARAQAVQALRPDDRAGQRGAGTTPMSTPVALTDVFERAVLRHNAALRDGEMTRFTKRKMTALAVASAALAAPIAQAGSAAPLTPAQTARLGAKTEAMGYTNITRYLVARSSGRTAQTGAATEAAGYIGITRYLVQQGERTAANGAQTEAAGFAGLTRYQVEHAAASPVATSGTGFSWDAALIGAGLATGVLLILGAAVVTTQMRKLQPHFR